MNLLLLAITFCWDLHPDTSIFRLYKDNVLNQEVTTTRATVTDLDVTGTYKFHVTAVKDELESLPSEPVVFHAPRMAMAAPGRFTFTRPVDRANQLYVVEATTDLVNWQRLDSVTETVVNTIDGIETVEVQVQVVNPHEFYRMRIEIVREGCASLP